MEMTQTKPFPQDSPEAQTLVDRARRLEEAADRAFVRWFNGEVKTASGAGRLRSQADEAWCDVRFDIERGDEIEAREFGYSQ